MRKLPALIIAVIFMLTACQPTPEKEVVAKSDGEKLEELINATENPGSAEMDVQITPGTSDSENDLGSVRGILDIPPAEQESPKWTRIADLLQRITKI